MLDKNLTVTTKDNSAPVTESEQIDTVTTNDTIDLFPVESADEPVADEQSTLSKESKYIPYSRFKEVIDERNRLRDQVQTHNNIPSDSASDGLPFADDEISDEELNMVWQENPAQAAKLMFSQMSAKEQARQRIADQSLAEAYTRYPELADPSHELPNLAKQIITREAPELRNNPRGLSIAVEMAAARYYRDQYAKMARHNGISLKGLEATRNADLKGAFVESGTRITPPAYHNCLSSEEQRVSKLMGVPVQAYANHKRSVQGGLR